MDKPLRYNKRNVHDVKVENGVVRVWNYNGSIDKKLIVNTFQALFKTGFVYPYIALMPDFHPGKGAMIGSVIPTKEVLLPTLIGNDIGCGMSALRLPVSVERFAPHLSDLKCKIKQAVPIGSDYNKVIVESVRKNPIMNRRESVSFIGERDWRKVTRQFGSLGGGNHFLEVQADEEGYIWVMLHSGSRYLGVRVRDYFVDRGGKHPDIDKGRYLKLPYLINGSDTAKAYRNALSYAMDFAKESRKEMMRRMLFLFSEFIPELEISSVESRLEGMIDVAHNYISLEKYFGKELFIHRKGAIWVGRKEKGIVPGSMGSVSYIVEGRGNEMSFCSCSHGAGRAMSRGEAFRTISQSTFKKSMAGIICDHAFDLRDEAPQAYKNIDKVMRGQKDIVKIIYKLKPLMSIKGN